MSTEDTSRRFIEESFPVKKVSEESAHEKTVRQGHISTLHLWWARRPLASSRATNYAALISWPRSEEDRQKTERFIGTLSKWENSTNREFVGRARSDILATNDGKQPIILDPFAGGGAIPLEALRLGCKVYASDYNPVATLLLKCTLEYPQKYCGVSEETYGPISNKADNKLLIDVEKWGTWVLEGVTRRIDEFYPKDQDGFFPVAYIWARTIPCQNPSCNAVIPLIRQYWLAKKSGMKVALLPYISGRSVEFKIVGANHEKMPKDFAPDNGTVSRAIATCPVCGSTIDDDDTRRLFARKQSAERMIAVVLNKEGTSGKIYRLATDQDILLFKKAEARLVEDRKSLTEEWGVDPVPDEPLPPAGTLGFRIQRYNMSSWGDLFNSRQKLAMVTFASTIRRAHNLMLSEGMEKEYAKAVTEYLALTFDKVADLNNCLCQWEADVESPRHLFVRQAIPITWDYAEANPVSGLTGSWQSMLRRTIGALQSIDFGTGPATVGQSSATSLPQQEGFFDAVLTDPPYYDNVPYSYLSDFFYVWLKRIIGELEPELFATPLTPKEEEIVAYSNRGSGPDGGKVFFEEMLKRSFKEIARVLKPNGISVIVYAHKSTAGWETLVNALLDSGLVVTGAWPIHTEMGARLRAQESAALASSIYIVARKTERLPLGLYKDVREELRTFLDARMEQLWRDGISGADFLVSAIGSSVQVYGKYAKVIKEDKAVRADVFLDDVRRIVTDYALRQVLHNGFASEISNLTRFYLLWRWAYGESPAVFDDARKLAQGSGIDLVSEWDRGFIRKDREMVVVLGPSQRRLPDIESLDKKDMIDVLHMALLLWEKGDRDALVGLLKETGYGSKDAFYRVAQAIAETLPKGAKEKLLLDGFVPARDRLGDEIRKGGSQTRLFE